MPKLNRLGLSIVGFGLALVTGCTSVDKYAWVKDLPVDAETSVTGDRHQDVRLYEIYETRDVDGKVWMRAKGFASVNDGTTPYFWDSRTPPNLEITVTKPDSEAYLQCKILFDKMTTTKTAVQLLGEGQFVAKGNDAEGHVGVFRIDRISRCTLMTKS